jgi:hypothetical protein
MRVPLSDSEKTEAMANSLEAQFQLMYDPSEPEVIEMVNNAMRANECALANES